TAQCQLKLLRRALRQVEELQVFAVLAPVIDITLELHLAVYLSPISDRCKYVARYRLTRLPQIADHWRKRRLKPKPLRARQFAIRPAVVQAPRKECSVRRQ